MSNFFLPQSVYMSEGVNLQRRPRGFSHSHVIPIMDLINGMMFLFPWTIWVVHCQNQLKGIWEQCRPRSASFYMQSNLVRHHLPISHRNFQETSVRLYLRNKQWSYSPWPVTFCFYNEKFPFINENVIITKHLRLSDQWIWKVNFIDWLRLVFCKHHS